MFSRIERIREFGVFEDYSRPTEMQAFGKINVIYGWNYSGKTTLSRVFGCLEAKKNHEDFPNARFSMSTHEGAQITEENVEDCPVCVRVFNTDFIERNLRWDGTSFSPILLLGENSVQIERRVARYERFRLKCEGAINELQQRNSDDEKKLEKAKTAEAKRIKSDLGIVEAFYTTHLDKYIDNLDTTGNFLLSDDAHLEDLRIATASESEQLPQISEISVDLRGESLFQQAKVLIATQPESRGAIDKLIEEPKLADWVKRGLDLHQSRNTCEFCAGDFSEQRRGILTAHFSTELRDLESKLRSLWEALEREKLRNIEVHVNDFAPKFRQEAGDLRQRLIDAVSSYEGWIEDAKGAVNNKLQSPFSDLSPPVSPESTVNFVSEAIQQVNALIRSHNSLVSTFSASKKSAVERLKTHYAQTFFRSEQLAERLEERKKRQTAVAKCQKLAKDCSDRSADLQAKINKAENGRKKINAYIETFLGPDTVRVSVVDMSGQQKFQLTRRGKVAKRLSEGEKTAIAFSFFLTKLEEGAKLDNVVVFIDDPISSLDSNHIFQIFSTLRETFLHRKANDQGDLAWTTRCLQLFVSTHNFEFFSLLRSLPHPKNKPIWLFHTKRYSVTASTLADLPKSIAKYSSEYHYTFDVLYSFHKSDSKGTPEHLLSIPNAARRFLELYTYTRLPLDKDSTVDQRAAELFGSDKAGSIVKLLHHFSHLQSVERMTKNNELIGNIETVISDLMNYLKTEDPRHYNALLESVS